MTRTGDREIGAVSGRLPDNPGELACMLLLCRKQKILHSLTSPNSRWLGSNGG